jgi:uncharacterized membrane protein
MGSFEIRVKVDRPLATVFAVYTQADTWRWCSYIRRVRWVHGKPWEEESRLQIETTRPFGAVVDQALMHFEPNARVDFISHFGGVTLQTRVAFRALPDDSTEIHGQLEFVGSFSRIAGFAIGPAIEQRTRQFFDDLKQECERTARPAHPVQPALNPVVSLSDTGQGNKEQQT